MKLGDKLFCVLSSKNPFDILQDSYITKNDTFRDNAASAYQLLLVIGIIGLVTSLIMIGLKLSINKNSSKRSEEKSKLGFKIWLGILFFSFVTLMGYIYLAITKVV